jgi:hypothetical protein
MKSIGIGINKNYKREGPETRKIWNFAPSIDDFFQKVGVNLRILSNLYQGILREKISECKMIGDNSEGNVNITKFWTWEFIEIKL